MDFLLERVVGLAGVQSVEFVLEIEEFVEDEVDRLDDELEVVGVRLLLLLHGLKLLGKA